MGKDKLDLEFFQTALKEAQDKCYKKIPEIKSSHRKGFVEACEIFHDGLEARKAAETELEKSRSASAQEAVANAEKAQQKGMKKAVKAANKVFEVLDLAENEGLEHAILKGSIIMHATPEGLAKFVEEDEKTNSKLIKTLLKSYPLMKEMLLNGGAADGKYGQAMKIYSTIMEDLPEDEKFTAVNMKLAVAVALELASPVNEFDTKIPVDAIKRFKHFEQAHRNGELDPAFPHFSIWELRHVVNCDAKDDQMQWGRDMVMNYAPYLTTVTDMKWRYLYILESDVLTRNPTWTDSPRTYQQVLSGGGKDAPNAWFGRFICKAFGIPTWGVKQPGKVALTRWTPTGWEAMLGADWDTCNWDGVAGIDFKAEVDARAAHSEEEYYKKLVLLENLADILDSRRGEIAEEEKVMLHPHRLWRSLAIVQKALMLVPASSDKFERSGKGVVKTKGEQYLEAFELDKPDGPIAAKGGKITVPASEHGFTSGNLMVITSWGGGKQLNFLADGKVEYEMPLGIDEKKYDLTIEVCSVHLKQAPLMVQVDDDEPIAVEIPYTIGEWKTIKACTVHVNEGSILRISRERPCFGLAIKKFKLK